MIKATSIIIFVQILSKIQMYKHPKYCNGLPRKMLQSRTETSPQKNTFYYRNYFALLSKDSQGWICVFHNLEILNNCWKFTLIHELSYLWDTVGVTLNKYKALWAFSFFLGWPELCIYKCGMPLDFFHSEIIKQKCLSIPPRVYDYFCNRPRS